MHQICGALSTDRRPPLIDVCRHFARKFDGAYSIVFLDALGNMMVARDPLGIKPLSYAVEGPLFAAASESVALLNLGFAAESIKSVPPGHAITISDGRLEIQPFAAGLSPSRPLLLRVGLFRQRGQHARRAERLSGPQGVGRGACPARNRADRREHRGGARARHEQGGGRRDGLCLEDSLRRGSDPQPLQRADVHRGQRQPPPQGRNQIHAAPRSARRQAGAAGRGLDRPGHDAAGACCSGFGSTASRGRFTSAWPARRSSALASTASTCRRSASCSRRGFSRAAR